MKEELTREVLEAMRQCLNYEECGECPVGGICPGIYKSIPKLATALLEEIGKPKVWDCAPEKAVTIDIYWSDKTNFVFGHKRYTRKLPKTSARIMAEEIASAKISNEKDLVDIIEQTINTHMKELKGEE